MRIISRSCPWCDRDVALNADGTPTYCPVCRHRADVARMLCTCAACGRTPGQIDRIKDAVNRRSLSDLREAAQDTRRN